MNCIHCCFEIVFVSNYGYCRLKTMHHRKHYCFLIGSCVFWLSSSSACFHRALHYINQRSAAHEGQAAGRRGAVGRAVASGTESLRLAVRRRAALFWMDGCVCGSRRAFEIAWQWWHSTGVHCLKQTQPKIGSQNVVDPYRV